MSGLMKELNIEQKGDYSQALLDEISNMIVEIKNQPRRLYSLLPMINTKFEHAKKMGLNIKSHLSQIQKFQVTILMDDMDNMLVKCKTADNISDFDSIKIESNYKSVSESIDSREELDNKYNKFISKLLEEKILFQLNKIANEGNPLEHDYEYIQSLIVEAMDKNILTDSLKSKLLQ